MVFVCAMLPRPGRAHDDVMRDETDMTVPTASGGSYEAADGSTRWHPDAAAALFFADCPPALATWAAARLRGQFWKVTREVTPLRTWPDVPCSAIIGSHDLGLSPAWSRPIPPGGPGVAPVALALGPPPFFPPP